MEIILYDVVLPKLVGPNLLKSYRRGNRPMYTCILFVLLPRN